MSQAMATSRLDQNDWVLQIEKFCLYLVQACLSYLPLLLSEWFLMFCEYFEVCPIIHQDLQ